LFPCAQELFKVCRPPSSSERLTGAQAATAAAASSADIGDLLEGSMVR
jgi:hypothetical protein